MKTLFIFLITFCSIASNRIHSQESQADKHSKIYFSLGGGAGIKSQLMGFGGTCILPKEWGFSLSYKGSNYQARNLPSDYYQGLDFQKPFDYLHVLSFNYLKEFSTSTKLIRYGIEGGPSLVTEGIAAFTYKPLNGLEDLFESNYSYSYTKKSTVGLSVRAKIEFPLTRFAGLEIAGFANVNSFQSIIGGEIYLTLGKIRDRIKTKQK